MELTPDQRARRTEAKRRYRHAHPDRVKEAARTYRTRYPEKLAAKSRARYLRTQLDTCPQCGGSKTKEAARCRICVRGETKIPTPKPGVELWCACGAPRTRYGKLCRSCAQKTSQRTRAGRSRGVIPALNPHCPHTLSPCDITRPHEHCPSCDMPTVVDAGWCAMCRREAERGAAMSERDSLMHERAA